MGGKTTHRMIKARLETTHSMVAEAFSYDLAGELRRYGEVVNTDKRRIRFRGIDFPLTHIIWMIVHREWPKFIVDHKDCDHANIAWINLRPATDQQNSMNKRIRCDNQIGVKGVQRHGIGYRARIRVGRDCYDLGTFSESWMAAAAYRIASAVMHGEFGRT